MKSFGEDSLDGKRISLRRVLTALMFAGTMLKPIESRSSPSVSAEANTRAAIGRVSRLNPKLHAVIAIDPTAISQARALDRAGGSRGILFGLPVLIKDNIEAAGPLPTTAGSVAMLGNVTHRDASIVARLR